MDIPIIGQRSTPQRTIEVCRSFAYKLNLANHGGPQYESVDLFASRKITCSEEDASWVSQQLFDECVEEVKTAIASIKAKLSRKSEELARRAR